MAKINRLNRKSYVVSILLSWFIIVFGFQLDFLLYTFTGTDFDSNKFGMPFLLLSVIAHIAYWAVAGVRRLHDMNESGWYFLLAIIPLAGLAVALPMLFKKGTDGKNKYGKPVKGLFIIGWSSDTQEHEREAGEKKPKSLEKKLPTNKIIKRLISLLVILSVVGPVYVVTHWDSDDNPFKDDTSITHEVRQSIIDDIAATNNGLTTQDGECVADVLIGHHSEEVLQSGTFDDIWTPAIQHQLLNRCEVELGQ